MSIGNITAYRGRDAIDANGEKIGAIDEIYEDTGTGKPEWLAVKTGLFDSNVSFLPSLRPRRARADYRRQRRSRDGRSGPVEEEHEVVPHEDTAVVDKEVVPKERIRLDKDVTTDQQRVSEEVRKEQIEVDGDADRR